MSNGTRGPGAGESHMVWRTPVVCYVLLAFLLGGVTLAGGSRRLVLGQSIPIEPARAACVQQRIDPNTAPWPELARLPMIGETLARRIVAYRREQAAAGAEGLAFTCLEDLDPVRGIGPKRLERLAPLLMFPPEEGRTGR